MAFDISKIEPNTNEEVLLYNKKWISDCNPKGVRIGFKNADGDFVTAEYSEYKDAYYNRDSSINDESFESSQGVDQVPTHWSKIERAF